MNHSVDTVGRAAKHDPMPARLDFLQSASALFLGLFMWGHMLFVSSILLGKDVMYTVTKFFEGYYFFGKSYPVLVTLIVAFVASMFILHAVLAMRKFPGNWREYRAFMRHKKQLAHADTSEWFVQVYTGFAMLFLGSVHLYLMMTHPGEIGPYASADRVWSQWLWPLDLMLLLAVEFHGGIGLYRLAIKWGWFEGDDPRRSRARLVRVKWGLITFLLTLGLMSLAAYMKIGSEHADRVGERYHPAAAVEAPALEPALIVPRQGDVT
jgi:fumarate reductase subunit C